MANVYGEVAPGQEELIARFDDEGRLYVKIDDVEEYIGYVDYDSGEVYDMDDELIGWIEENGSVILSNENEEEEYEIGFVDEDANMFIYISEDGEKEAVGRIEEMKHPVEGAAALLFFIEDDEEGED